MVVNGLDLSHGGSAAGMLDVFPDLSSKDEVHCKRPSVLILHPGQASKARDHRSSQKAMADQEKFRAPLPAMLARRIRQYP